MLENMIDPEELKELSDDGASVSVEEEPTTIADWTKLIDQMARIAKANETIANKQSEEIKDTLVKLVQVLEKKKIDMTPLISLLGDIRNNTNDNRQGYRFTMHRKTSNQLLDYVDAMPIKETVN